MQGDPRVPTPTGTKPLPRRCYTIPAPEKRIAAPARARRIPESICSGSDIRPIGPCRVLCNIHTYDRWMLYGRTQGPPHRGQVKIKASHKRTIMEEGRGSPYKRKLKKERQTDQGIRAM